MNILKTNKNLIIIVASLILFCIISIISIYSSKFIVSNEYNNLYIKQICWYIISVLFLFLILKFKVRPLLKFSYIIYFINIVLLILVLIFGTEINNARSWFEIPYLGNFQPSELMKISLILVLSKVSEEFYYKEHKDLKLELIFIIKVFILTLIPSFLTFIEPDTGTVIFFLLIMLSVLFISGLRLRWFIGFISILIIIAVIFFIVYFNFKDTFVNIFGHSFFYRIHRVLDWTNSSGMQLENSLIAIGSSHIIGNGFSNTPIYFPEPYTDFIFSVFTSNFGLLGGLFLIAIIITFIYSIFYTAIKDKDIINKLLIGGILICLIFAYIQNISMTIGILPIMGITLPFISYGGSSLVTYFIMIAIVISIIIDRNNKNSKNL